MTMKQVATFLFLLIFTLASLLADGNRAGLSSNLFLRAELSPRAAALGGAYTAVGNDAHAMYFNPAGIARLKTAQVSFTHVQWFEDIRMQNLSMVFKLAPELAVGFGFSYLGLPQIQGKDRFGQPTEGVEVNSSVAQMNVAYKLHPSFMVGIGIKYFKDNLAGFVASGMAVDFGFSMETMLNGLFIGGSVQNLGNDIRYDQIDEPIPLTYRAGLGYRIPGTSIQISVDGVRSIDSNWRLATGIELSYHRFAFLRAGNRWLGNEGMQPAFGLGLRPLKDLRFDYTMFNHQNLGITHRFSLSFDFGLFKQKKTSTEVSAFLLYPPKRVYAYVDGNRIKVEWSDVPGAQYNVYVRRSNDKKWTKVFKHPLWAHETAFKKPQHKAQIDIAVTSVIDGKESSFSRIVTVEVK